MGRYDGEDYADESGYASSSMQDAVRRGYPPAEGYVGYPAARMYPTCERCTHRHGVGAGCVGVVGERDLEKQVEAARLRRKETDLAAAISLLEKSGFTVTKSLDQSSSDKE